MGLIDAKDVRTCFLHVFECIIVVQAGFFTNTIVILAVDPYKLVLVMQYRWVTPVAPMFIFLP